MKNIQEITSRYVLPTVEEKTAYGYKRQDPYTKLFEERIIFLGGTPDMSKRDAIHVGQDVPAMLQSDLNVEYTVQKLLKQTMALCEQEQDYVTRHMLQGLLDDTENDHAHWLEQQLRLIKLLGLANYQQSQL